MRPEFATKPCGDHQLTHCLSVRDGYRLHRTSGREVALDLDPTAVSTDNTDWKRESGRGSVKDEAQYVAIVQY
jgi:hypothetical protein